MSDGINHCHLHLVYVSDDPKTHGTFFPIESIPLDDPFHPDHPDNNQPRKAKTGGSKTCQCKSSSLQSAQEPSHSSKPNKNVPVKKKPAQEPSSNSKPSKNVPDKKKPAQEPSPYSKPRKNVPSTPSKPDKTKPAKEPSPLSEPVKKNET